MKLLLLRHAKAEPADAGTSDEARPLAMRGRNAADAMGAYIAEQGYAPAMVLCSPARRTRETLEGVQGSFAARPDIRFEPPLYLSGWPVLLREIQCAERESPLLIIGHNPGLHDLAMALARNETENARLRKLAAKFPTSALAVFDCPVERWCDLRAGSALLADFMRAKKLIGGDDE